MFCLFQGNTEDKLKALKIADELANIQHYQFYEKA